MNASMEVVSVSTPAKLTAPRRSTTGKEPQPAARLSETAGPGPGGRRTEGGWGHAGRPADLDRAAPAVAGNDDGGPGGTGARGLRSHRLPGHGRAVGVKPPGGD